MDDKEHHRADKSTDYSLNLMVDTLQQGMDASAFRGGYYDTLEKRFRNSQSKGDKKKEEEEAQAENMTTDDMKKKLSDWTAGDVEKKIKEAPSWMYIGAGAVLLLCLSSRRQ
jgi:hypothetical protein